MQINASIHHPATASLFCSNTIGETPASPGQSFFSAPGPFAIVWLPCIRAFHANAASMATSTPLTHSPSHHAISHPASCQNRPPSPSPTQDACSSWLPCPPGLTSLDGLNPVCPEGKKGSLLRSSLATAAANLVLTALCGDTIRGI